MATRGRDRLPQQPQRVRRALARGGLTSSGVIDLSFDGDITLNYTTGLEAVAGSLVVHFLDGEILPFGTGSDYSMGYYLATDELRIVDGTDLNANIRLAMDSSGNFDFTAGNLTTTGSGTLGQITIFNASPILVFKDSTSAGDVSRGVIEWRDLNNTRLGYFGNSSESNDDLLWKNESTGGHIQIQTTGAGEFQIFANTVLDGNLSTTGYGDFGSVYLGGTKFMFNSGTRNVWIGDLAGRDWTSGLDDVGVGYAALANIEDGDDDTGVGSYAGWAITSGSRNTCIGRNAGYNITTGNANTCIGKGAGYSMTTVTGNFMAGVDAGRSVTSGIENFCLGTVAGYLLTTGRSNTLLGYAAGYNLGGSSYNMALGSYALYLTTSGTANVAIGTNAGYAVTSGDQNFLGGVAAGRYLTTGGDNIFLGYHAGFDMTTGGFNIFIGNESTSAVVDLSSVVVIGHQAQPTATRQLILGSADVDGSLTSGYLGSGVVKVTPDDFILQATGGSGTDNEGANFILAGGKSTGDATPGNVIIQISTAGASGVTLQTLATVVTLSSALADFEGLNLTTTGEITGGGAKCKMTSIGGYAIKLTNETGVASVVGQLVKADTAANDAVVLAGIGDVECFGVFLDAGIADGAEAWVVVCGIADVAFDDNVAAVRGNWVATGAAAGYARTAASPAASPQHFEEIGHCIESVTAGGGGTHILARCVLHFN